MHLNLEGTGVALVTPFNEDKSVDLNSLTKLVNHCIDGGVDYLVVMGTTGESIVLSDQEKISVLEHVQNINNGRLPIVLGLGGSNTNKLSKQLKEMNIDRVDAILSVTPYYNKPTQEGIYQHFKTLSESSKLPIILYNVPGRTSCNMTSETTLRLAYEFDNIIAIKEASGDLNQIINIINEKPNDFLVISGDDSLTLSTCLLGGKGVISVLGQAYPKRFSLMVSNAINGNLVEANKLHYELLDVLTPLYEDGNPSGVKALLSIMGICKNQLRLPLVPVSQNVKLSLEKFNNQLD